MKFEVGDLFIAMKGSYGDLRILRIYGATFILYICYDSSIRMECSISEEVLEELIDKGIYKHIRLSERIERVLNV